MIGCMNVKKIVNGIESVYFVSYYFFGNLWISYNRMVIMINIVV